MCYCADVPPPVVVNIRPEPAREPAVELPPDGQVEGVDGEWMEDEEEEGEGGEDAAAAAMAAMMGFGGFGSSKVGVASLSLASLGYSPTDLTSFISAQGKHVPSNQNGDVVIVKPRTWRQYMNRRAPFLDGSCCRLLGTDRPILRSSQEGRLQPVRTNSRCRPRSVTRC